MNIKRGKEKKKGFVNQAYKHTGTIVARPFYLCRRPKSLAVRQNCPGFTLTSNMLEVNHSHVFS